MANKLSGRSTGMFGGASRAMGELGIDVDSVKTSNEGVKFLASEPCLFRLTPPVHTANSNDTIQMQRAFEYITTDRQDIINRSE